MTVATKSEQLIEPIVENATYWDIVNSASMGRYLTKVEGRFISQCLAKKPWVRTVLDIGGGGGRFAIPLHQAGYQLLVTDTNKEALDILGRRAHLIQRALVGDRIGEQPIAESSVDCVLCIEVPVVDDLKMFLAECRRVLRTAGIVIFVVHNRLSYKGVLKAVANHRQSAPYYGQIYRHTIFQIHACLRATGFKLLQQQGFNWVPAVRNADGHLVSAGVRLERLLGLSRLAYFSPWLLVAAQKR